MATPLRKSLEEITSCPICYENTENNCMLPCNHLICKDCLDKLDKKNNKVTCPKCKFVHQCQKNFPNDFIGKEVRKYFTETDKIVSCRLCAGCTDSGNPVKKFCENCKHAYCQTCLSKHNKAFPDHALYETKESGHQVCSVHPEELVENKCSTHGIYICNICVLCHYQPDCKIVKASDILADFIISAQDKMEKLRSQEEMVHHKYIACLNKQREKAKQSYRKSKGGIENEARKRHEVVERSKNDLIHKLDQDHKLSLQTLNDAEENYNKKQKEYEEKCERAKKVLNSVALGNISLKEQEFTSLVRNAQTLSADACKIEVKEVSPPEFKSKPLPEESETLGMLSSLNGKALEFSLLDDKSTTSKEGDNEATTPKTQIGQYEDEKTEK